MNEHQLKRKFLYYELLMNIIPKILVIFKSYFIFTSLLLCSAFVFNSCDSLENFQGGIRLVLHFDFSESEAGEEHIQAQQVKEIVENRLESFGVRKFRLRLERNECLFVETLDNDAVREIKNLVSQPLF